MKLTSTFLCVTLCTTAAFSQSVIPDPGFGSNGVVITPESGKSGVIYSSAIQADGRIIAAGELYDSVVRHSFLVRYLPNGSIDASFGIQGKVVTEVGNRDAISSVIVQTDGKIVAAGNQTIITQNPPGPSVTITNKPFIVRYLTNGTLDSAFGTNGIHQLDILDPYAAKQVATIVQRPDGRLVAGGYNVSSVSALPQMMLVCLQPDGSYDAGFGANGLAMYTIETGNGAVLYDMNLQQDGMLMLAGYSGQASITAPPDTRMALARVQPNGALDAAFGNNGTLAIQIDTSAYPADMARSVRVQQNGKIVMAGASGGHLAVVRLNADGSPDPSFGQAGIVTDGTRPAAEALCLLSSGQMLISGVVANANPYTTDVTLSRFTSGGMLDASFGIAGNVLINQSDKDRAYSLLVQPDSKILLAGHSVDPISSKVSFTLWRLADPAASNGVLETATGIRFYPNPTLGDLILSFQSTPVQPAVVRLFDMRGMLVASKNVQSTSAVLPMGHLSPGVYMLGVEAAGSVEVFKVVRE